MTSMTPTTYAKKRDIRPQYVYNWIKQGAPSKLLGGKKYIDDGEMDKWVENRNAEKKEQKETRAQQAAAKEAIPEAYREKYYAATKGSRVVGLCSNCETDQEYIVDVMLGGDMGSYIRGNCLGCGLNVRFEKVEVQWVYDLLDEKVPWRIPLYNEEEERAILVEKKKAEEESAWNDIKDFADEEPEDNLIAVADDGE